MSVGGEYRFQNVLFNPIFYPVENLEAYLMLTFCSHVLSHYMCLVIYNFIIK